ncbi:MAG TPA: dihydrofolate reductase family protein [Streptosporangiaceae bacterium]|nr:dihydrofolate reductase family protein [Streptosporangiaceae bacterium]
MRKIINSTYITLDGVIENPQDWPPTKDDEGAGFAVQTELLSACDAVLMGRRTYDSFAAAWPSRSGDPYSDRINSMAKYVVSSTLRRPEWNNTTVISGNVIDEIRRLKDGPGRDIVQYGFGQVSTALMEHGLLDELRLWVHPFFLGRGDPEDLLFRPRLLTRFELIEATAMKSGIAVLTYRFDPLTASAPTDA